MVASTAMVRPPAFDFGGPVSRAPLTHLTCRRTVSLPVVRSRSQCIPVRINIRYSSPSSSPAVMVRNRWACSGVHAPADRGVGWEGQGAGQVPADQPSPDRGVQGAVQGGVDPVQGGRPDWVFPLAVALQDCGEHGLDVLGP